MYPNLYFAFKDLFGVEWNFLRFVNSFGFFVAIAFIVSAIVLANELKRKSKQGLFQPTEMQITVGKPASYLDLGLNFLLGFLLGYKIVALFIMDSSATEDPQAFIFSTLGSWPAGILLGLLFAGMKWWEKNKQKLAKPETRNVRIWPHDRVGEITILALVFGLLGAKLFDIFENWSDFLKHPNDYIFSAKGLTFYGGLICAALAIWWYAKKHKIGFWHFSWMPDWVWPYKYPHNVNEFGDIKIPGCEGKYCNELAAGVFPTPLYEIIVCFLLFLLLMSLRKRLKVPGTMFALYLMFNGMERFFIEKIRVNNRLDLFGFHPTQAEVISTLLFLTGLGIWFYVTRKAKHKMAATNTTKSI